jgi:hypothetical protein
MIGCRFLYIDFETIATILLLLGIMSTMDGNIEMFIQVFQYLKQYQNFRLFFIVYRANCNFPLYVSGNFNSPLYLLN